MTCPRSTLGRSATAYRAATPTPAAAIRPIHWRAAPAIGMRRAAPEQERPGPGRDQEDGQRHEIADEGPVGVRVRAVPVLEPGEARRRDGKRGAAGRGVASRPPGTGRIRRTEPRLERRRQHQAGDRGQRGEVDRDLGADRHAGECGPAAMAVAERDHQQPQPAEPERLRRHLCERVAGDVRLCQARRQRDGRDEAEPRPGDRMASAAKNASAEAGDQRHQEEHRPVAGRDLRHRQHPRQRRRLDQVDLAAVAGQVGEPGRPAPDTGHGAERRAGDSRRRRLAGAGQPADPPRRRRQGRDRSRRARRRRRR